MSARCCATRQPSPTARPRGLPAGEDVSKAQRIATLGAGEHVGETALRFNTPRNATVRATTRVCTLSLEASDFRELFRRLAVA